MGRLRTDTITDMKKKRLLNTREMQGYIGQGKDLARRFCDEIGATRKFGSRVLFDREVIDRALDRMALEASAR
ncbi:MAG: polyprenyl synthetase solanesyl diphosphate synthase [Stomatobaculum sp.]|nr:polyprenyl synthetase solanesyl diphosphate synthase [Stomatobaculum sp.]